MPAIPLIPQLLPPFTRRQLFLAVARALLGWLLMWAAFNPLAPSPFIEDFPRLAIGWDWIPFAVVGGSGGLIHIAGTFPLIMAWVFSNRHYRD